jgi:hypothetical protein
VNLTLFDTLVGSAGDLNNDGLLDINDLTALTEAIRLGSEDLQFDVNQSGDIDLADRLYWVTELRHTWMGDANLDGEFNSGDLKRSDYDAGQCDAIAKLAIRRAMSIVCLLPVTCRVT